MYGQDNIKNEIVPYLNRQGIHYLKIKSRWGVGVGGGLLWMDFHIIWDVYWLAERLHASQGLVTICADIKISEILYTNCIDELSEQYLLP